MDAGMDLLERDALGMAIRKAQDEGKLDDFVEKSSDAIVKAHFKIKKTKKDDDSDFTIDEKDKKPKTKAKTEGIKSRRGRPAKVKPKSKVSLLVKSLLEERVPEAVLLIDHTFKCIQLEEDRNDIGGLAMKCFYDYIDRIVFPRFSFYFANAGPLPSPELHKMKSLYAEDYIYIVYKYMQENDKI